MEKLLAMSILSSAPAEISGSGSGSGSWMMNMSLFKNIKKSGEVAAESKKSNNSGELSKQRLLPPPPPSQDEKKRQEEGKESSRPRARTWFAPEFDGLNCFENIVSH